MAPGAAEAQRKRRNAEARRIEPQIWGVHAVNCHVRHASAATGSTSAANVLQYSTKSFWQSYARAKEKLVLALCVRFLLVYRVINGLTLEPLVL